MSFERNLSELDLRIAAQPLQIRLSEASSASVLAPSSLWPVECLEDSVVLGQTAGFDNAYLPTKFRQNSQRGHVGMLMETIFFLVRHFHEHLAQQPNLTSLR